MNEAAVELRRLFSGPDFVQQPAVFNGLTARLAQNLGFKALGLGGYAMGAATAMSEPLLSLEDIARFTREVTAVCPLPVTVDIGTGYGESLHVRHSVRTVERAGAAAIHIEDQYYPKRVRYHEGIEEIVPLEAMLTRLRAAIEGKLSPEFVIVGRTDAMRTDGYAEGIRRARAFVEAGADAIMIFPNSEQEAKQAPKDLPGVPLVYVNSPGNGFGRPVFNTNALASWGWKVSSEAILLTNVTAGAVVGALTSLRDTGETGIDLDQVKESRRFAEAAVGLEELYELERRTVNVK